MIYWLLIGLLVLAAIFAMLRLVLWLLVRLGKWNRD
jgi:hypothetical protein